MILHGLNSRRSIQQMQKTLVCKVPQDQQPALGVPRDFGMTAVALLPSRTVSLVLSAHGAARTDKTCQCIVQQLCSMQHVPCISRYNSLSFYVSFYLIYVHVIARAQCIAMWKEGALSLHACMECPSGRFSNRTGLDSLVKCDACPGGTWSDVAGATSANVCVKCAAGKWSPQIAAISEAGG